MDRRSFCSFAPALLLPQGRAQSGKLPNILYCLADDWSFEHASILGDPVVKTPTFDRVAKEGVLFTHAFSAAPTCTASRAAMLTGQAPHRLREGGNLYGPLSKEFPVYPDLLEQAGYTVGFTRKGWGPGDFKAGGRTRNPAGTQFTDFAAFLNQVPSERPFCFWFGSTDPHRAYDRGTGLKSGMRLEDVKVPAMWPDTPEVRSDILDYYFEVQRFDREVGELLDLVEKSGRARDTMVVISGDNGRPFPRSKANLYDAGTRQPLAVRWPAAVSGGRVLDDFISLADLAPTFAEAAGLKPPNEMTGRSFLSLLRGAERSGGRDRVFVERERHANVRKGDLGYPSRAIRTREFLYIRNFRPDRWPAGDPEFWFSVGPFGDCDESPTKKVILDRRNERGMERSFELCFGKRPAEELYDVKQDPQQINNLAGRREHAAAQKKMKGLLEQWMKETGDPRAVRDQDPWDRYPYSGGRTQPAKTNKKP
jgi:arylsulfatase A-like enzyme